MKFATRFIHSNVEHLIKIIFVNRGFCRVGFFVTKNQNRCKFYNSLIEFMYSKMNCDARDVRCLEGRRNFFIKINDVTRNYAERFSRVAERIFRPRGSRASRWHWRSGKVGSYQSVSGLLRGKFFGLYGRIARNRPTVGARASECFMARSFCR